MITAKAGYKSINNLWVATVKWAKIRQKSLNFLSNYLFIFKIYQLLCINNEAIVKYCEKFMVFFYLMIKLESYLILHGMFSARLGTI